MSSGNRRASGKRDRKRKFQGNRYSHSSNVDELSLSASSKKLKSSCFDNQIADEKFSGYRIIDVKLFFKEIAHHLCCKICHSEIKIEEMTACGLESKFSIICSSCHKIKDFKSSPLSTTEKNVCEINTRIIYAMRCIGSGWAALKTFCCVMDLPPPVQKSTYTKIVKNISSGVSKAAEMSMKNAAEREVELNGNTQITVSGDGSWKTRGHSSQIGLTSVIGDETGKVLDIEVMSSFCKGCTEWKGLKSGPDYVSWQDKHAESCLKNHMGSAGKMEVDGMIKIFTRSEINHGVQYVNYIGDGDTKTFLNLHDSHVYGPDIEIKKVECVGHVQKRMGTRLRNLKKNQRGKKLEDGKTLCGKGRLTDKLINEISVFYGNAIRNNKDSLVNMRKAVWAVYYHKRSTDQEPLHDFCPAGGDSWCRYQRSVVSRTVKEFKHKSVVPAAVMDSIKGIFKDLSNPELLKRCLGGKTQNANESFNSLVWKFCPKTSGSSRLIADIASYEAVLMFNDGWKGRLHSMNFLGFRVGQNALNASVKFDEKRLVDANRKHLEMNLEQRRAKRMQKLKKITALKKSEGPVYEAGKF